MFNAMHMVSQKYRKSRLIITGCGIFYIFLLATGPAFAQDVPQKSLEVVDLRPPDEDKPRYISTSIFSCGYFIRVLNDDGRAVKRVDLLREFLRGHLGARGVGHVLEIDSYQIFFNEAAAQFDTAMAVAIGSVGGTSIGNSRTAPKCGQEKTPNGWFDPYETTNSNPPIVVQISGRFDGVVFSVRSVYSPSTKLSTLGTLWTSKAKKNLSDSKAIPEVNAAISKANMVIAERILALIH